MSDAPIRHWRVLGSTPLPRTVARASAPVPPAPAADANPGPSPARTTCRANAADEMPCDRCGTPTYRMHAVWRCPKCGYKSDCCGW